VKVIPLLERVTFGEVAPAPRLFVIVMLQADPPAPDTGVLKLADHARLPAVNPVTVEDPAQPVPPHVAVLMEVGVTPV
jgi:hypothetical protein